MNKIRQFETVDLQNSPDSTRHDTHTIEIQMKEQQNPEAGIHDREPGKRHLEPGNVTGIRETSPEAGNHHREPRQIQVKNISFHF